MQNLYHTLYQRIHMYTIIITIVTTTSNQPTISLMEFLTVPTIYHFQLLLSSARDCGQRALKATQSLIVKKKLTCERTSTVKGEQSTNILAHRVQTYMLLINQTMTLLRLGHRHIITIIICLWPRPIANTQLIRSGHHHLGQLQFVNEIEKLARKN